MYKPDQNIKDLVDFTDPNNGDYDRYDDYATTAVPVGNTENNQ